MIEIANRLSGVVRDAEPRLRAIAETRAGERREPAAWSAKEVLGHLIDSASNNHQRFVRIQFDNNLSLPAYAQEQWVSAQGYAQSDWGSLIALWSAYNVHLSNVIGRIPKDKLECAQALAGRSQ